MVTVPSQPFSLLGVVGLIRGLTGINSPVGDRCDEIRGELKFFQMGVGSVCLSLFFEPSWVVFVYLLICTVVVDLELSILKLQKHLSMHEIDLCHLGKR